MATRQLVRIIGQLQHIDRQAATDGALLATFVERREDDAFGTAQGASGMGDGATSVASSRTAEEIASPKSAFISPRTHLAR